MPTSEEVSALRTPEDCLRLAVESSNPDGRAAYAREGLSADALDPDTRFLLLRQLYLSQLAEESLPDAAKTAQAMAALKTSLTDIGHHDAARVYEAMGQRDAAIARQRLAARTAPPDRRSFQWWSLGTLLHFSGDPEGAQSAFIKGERWSQEDRPLLRAHGAWVALESGEVVEGLAEITAELERGKARNGYGTLVLGMLRYLMGDHRAAAAALRSWLRRNASLDLAKAMTLGEELRRARTILAELESD